MICLNMDGRNFESDAGIIREQEVRIMQNGKTKGYSSAWLHHKGRNKHHYEYWLDYDSHGEGKLVGMKMPVRYVVEMFMDRIAACKVYKGAAYKDSDPLIYYNSGKAGDMMHKDTRKLLEKLLHMLAEQGEETVFCYVRREILKKK